MTPWLQTLFGQGPRLTPQAALAAPKTAGPDTLSADVASMQSIWRTIADVLEGHDAIKAAGERYLPKFEKESREKYQRRLMDAPWRPIFPAALESLAAKPFQKPVTLNGTPPKAMQTFAENVDGRGNSLSVFARILFDDAVAFGPGLFMVDYSRSVPRADGKPLTRADERAQGLRPYWVRIHPRDIIDIRTEWVRGREVVTHARFFERAAVANGFAEETVTRVRFLERDTGGAGARWTLWQQATGGAWIEIDSGLITIGEIPLVMFHVGKRKGVVSCKPWSYELCHVALEYYRSLARQTEIENFSGWPILAGQGVAKPDDADSITVGPHAVLYAQPSGDGGRPEWELIGPDAALVAEIAKGPERIAEVFSKLALEPTLPRSNVTATAAGIDNSRAHSAIESWAIALKNALDEGLAFTAKWLQIADVTTANVSTDFAALAGGAEEAKVLASAQQRGVISAKTERNELRRRSILGPDAPDDETEEEQIALEREGLEPEFETNPRTGEPIDPAERLEAAE
ncbi:DUF4055 domain-containing protein [Pseudorhodoplanes sp.]|uniref:DUF4055 domain-containing protein n=1 Tax=Pseudorhodoplanes sp. TaxID=1934341 RepID=UPI002CA41E3B|nr:DUF4055 domain-containing protein [Pseudorhodoplanes sp.]HWV41316.1 DUF4055 domain-containing protein [Pseudorhodoplanes sp.]